MSVKYRVDGVDDALASLNRAIGKVQGNVANGVEAAGQLVKGEAQSLTSIDEGVLVNSAFARMVGTKRHPAVAVGYTADYAAAVHEKPDGTNWNRPGAENKFLEKAVTRNLGKIANLIRNVAGRG